MRSWAKRRTVSRIRLSSSERHDSGPAEKSTGERKARGVHERLRHETIHIILPTGKLARSAHSAPVDRFGAQISPKGTVKTPCQKTALLKVSMMSPVTLLCASRSYSWHDPALIAERARGLSGLEFFASMGRGDIPTAPVFATLGIEMAEFEVEHGRVAMQFTPQRVSLQRDRQRAWRRHHNAAGHGCRLCRPFDACRRNRFHDGRDQGELHASCPRRFRRHAVRRQSNHRRTHHRYSRGTIDGQPGPHHAPSPRQPACCFHTLPDLRKDLRICQVKRSGACLR